MTVNAYGTIEIVFQHLATRAPFDEPELREEMRQRLNRVRGIDLADDRLLKRPPFSLEVLADANARTAIIETLEWFMSELDRFDTEASEAA